MNLPVLLLSQEDFYHRRQEAAGVGHGDHQGCWAVGKEGRAAWRKLDLDDAMLHQGSSASLRSVPRQGW